MSEHAPLVFSAPVLLLGGAPAEMAEVTALAARCGAVVAADGGANRLRGGPLRPDAVIGDMDSVEDLSAWEAAPGVRVLRAAEQNSTDLEKCLRLTRAPLYIGAGFLGGRMDHTFAAAHALLAHADRKVVLTGAEDLAFLAPARWRARLEAGARVSVYPLVACRGVSSKGLRWPLDGLEMAAGRAIGTSNMAVEAVVEAEFDRPGALILLERRFLDAAIESITC